MCLSTKWSKKEKEAWLKEQPERVTAYKVVSVGQYRFRPRLKPPYVDEKTRYKRRNLLISTKTGDEGKTSFTKFRSEKDPGHGRSTTYVAYYHLFLSHFDACEWGREVGNIVMTCEIPKKYITEMGTQQGKTVIVTRCFEFTDADDKFFGEKQ